MRTRGQVLDDISRLRAELVEIELDEKNNNEKRYINYIRSMCKDSLSFIGTEFIHEADFVGRTRIGEYTVSFKIGCVMIEQKGVGNMLTFFYEEMNSMQLIELLRAAVALCKRSKDGKG